MTDQKKEFPVDCLKRYIYSKDLQITALTKDFNNMANSTKVMQIRPVMVTNWLRREGYLEFFTDESTNRKMSTPTKKGREIGLHYKTRKAPTGESYRAIIYTKDAQQFLISNITKILNNEPL